MTAEMLAQSPEVHWLVLSLLITAFYWVPYILNMLARAGVWGALSSSSPWTIELADWATRARRAHANQVENLVIFAPLAILVPLTGSSTENTALAAMIFFVARLVHFVVYILGIPVVRTLAFAVGALCTLYLALVLLGMA